MITPNDAFDIVRKKYPRGEFYNAFEYNELFYVFRLQEGKKSTLNSTYLAVNKNSGALTSVSPVSDFKGFFADMREHPIDVKGVKRDGVLQMA